MGTASVLGWAGAVLVYPQAVVCHTNVSGAPSSSLIWPFGIGGGSLSGLILYLRMMVSFPVDKKVALSYISIQMCKK